MEIKYVLITDIFGSDDTTRIGYGIALVSVNDDVMSVLQTVVDMSSDRVSVEKFIETCNTLELDPVHLQDAVEDFIADL